MKNFNFMEFEQLIMVFVSVLGGENDKSIRVTEKLSFIVEFREGRRRGALYTLIASSSVR